MILFILVIAGLGGCEPYRIERHKRSPIFFNQDVVDGEIQREVTLEDGTILIFEPIDTSSNFGRTGKEANKPFLIREEGEDGKITLRALMPEHVLINLLACLRRSEYELIYQQLLAEVTRNRYEAEGGYDVFANYMERQRIELAKLLTRMIAAIPQQQMKFTRLGEGVTRCQLRPQVAQQFKFKAIDVWRDKWGQYKLMMIY